MKPPAVIAIALLAGTVGFLAGRVTGPGARTDGDVSTEHARRTDRAAAADSGSDSRTSAGFGGTRPADPDPAGGGRKRAVDGTDGTKNADAESGAASEDLPAGTRRKNGTIVGGAKFDQNQISTALGFLHSYAERFFNDADLTADQTTRLRAELDKRIAEGMQIGADLLNEDIDGEQAYELLSNIEKDARRTLSSVLNEEQMETYQRFEREIKGFMNTQVVNNELATIRRRLNLDPEQVKTVRKLVTERWTKVQEKYGTAPLPNVYFAPVRRRSDAAIHEAAAASIREVLRPEQARAFDKLEADPYAVLRQYRSLLVPK